MADNPKEIGLPPAVAAPVSRYRKYLYGNYILLERNRTPCPECGFGLVAASGCAYCPSCGWGKCG